MKKKKNLILASTQKYMKHFCQYFERAQQVRLRILAGAHLFLQDIIAGRL